MMWLREKEAGVTLLEIIIAMLLITMVATGIMAAFVFGRRVTLRSGAEMAFEGLATQVAEDLRLATDGDSPNLLIPLEEGIYYGTDVVGGPPVPADHLLPALEFPVIRNAAGNIRGDSPSRFRVRAGDGTLQAVLADACDGRFVIIEEVTDLDGDGETGSDFSVPADGVTDLRRVRIIVNFTTPTA